MKFKTRKDFPKKIRGNDGYEAVFTGELQPLGDGDFAGIYRYKRGTVVHYLEQIKEEDIIEK